MPVKIFHSFVEPESQLMDARELLTIMLVCGSGSADEIADALFTMYDTDCSNGITPVREHEACACVLLI